MRTMTIVHEPSARLVNALLLAFVVLLPVEPLYNVPLIMLGGLGLLRLAFRRARLGSPENRFLCIAFLCLWLPMLASLTDAVNLIESGRKTASACIYFLAGVYVTGAYTRAREPNLVLMGVTTICVFWCLDASWQFLTGTDWFGIPHREGERLPGLFHFPGRLGYVLACFAPIFFEGIRRTSRRWPWSPTLLVPFFMIITLSGTRSSWVTLAIGTAGYLLFLLFRRRGGPRWKPGRTVGVFTAVLMVVVLASYVWPDGADRARQIVEPRVESLPGLLSGDREVMEEATSLRISLWETALNMFAQHWLNGVGPKGFRHAYRKHNPERDYFLEGHPSQSPALFPHLLVLEIAAETGLIGLVGYVTLASAFLMKLRRLESGPFGSVYPYALTLIVILFPFDTHGSFYGTLSTGLIWWTIIMNASMLSIAYRKETEHSVGMMGT